MLGKKKSIGNNDLPQLLFSFLSAACEHNSWPRHFLKRSHSFMNIPGDRPKGPKKFPLGYNRKWEGKSTANDLYRKFDFREVQDNFSFSSCRACGILTTESEGSQHQQILQIPKEIWTLFSPFCHSYTSGWRERISFSQNCCSWRLILSPVYGDMNSMNSWNVFKQQQAGPSAWTLGTLGFSSSLSRGRGLLNLLCFIVCLNIPLNFH